MCGNRWSLQKLCRFHSFFSERPWLRCRPANKLKKWTKVSHMPRLGSFAVLSCACVSKSTFSVIRPSRCGWLAELYVIAEEPVTYLYNSGHSHWGDLWTGLQQRAAQAAGQASVDGGQVTVGGACWPNVRQSPHREVQKRTGCSALRQGRQTQPHRPIWREKISWVWNQRSPGMVEEMPGLDGTL